ncbi:hypothetical protein [Glycomyces sp. MUSA5-2]|uniref:hypothetical protein n=1 Tax=Glycomyces sp. MUSA5-2 TaxID=2053002 RepID=UPI00300AD91B
MLPYPFYGTNAIADGLLTIGDIDDFLTVAAEMATSAKLVGGTSTSLEDVGIELTYRLMNGRAVAEHLPRLQELYEQDFLHLAERVFGVGLIPSPDLVSGANINLLEGIGGRYEWHYDSNPYTGLLVLSPSSVRLGGRLLFGQDVDDQVALSMMPGDLFFFDARETAHSVEALATPRIRATIPMNYFVKGKPLIRPRDLDQTLYNGTLSE